MVKTTPTAVLLKKSDRSGKKWMVIIDGKKTHFGQLGAEDYTQHKDSERMKRYVVRHGGNKADSERREKWNIDGLQTAGFWSRWLLWSRPDFQEAINYMNKKFNLSISLEN